MVEQGLGRREGHADVELRDGDLEAKGCDLGHDGRHGGGDFTDDEVALEPDTVEGNAGGLERLDEVDHCRRLRTSIFYIASTVSIALDWLKERINQPIL